MWHMVLVLREVWRTLKDTGVVWWNIGDSFSSGNRHGHGTRIGYKQATNRGMSGACDPARPPQPDGYPQGTLLGIPQQVMLAAMADGWIVRNDCVWQKATPMPESVRGWRYEQPPCTCREPNRVLSGRQGYAKVGHREKSGSFSCTPSSLPDTTCPTCQGTGRAGELVLRRGSWRHTRAHEAVLMLTKQMGYFSDGEAVKESLAETNAQRTTMHYNTAARYGGKNGGNSGLDDLAQKMRQGLHGGRNPRSVLTPAPSALALEHYASFPPGLIEPLIKATCPAQCCAVCGQGWAPTLQDTGQPETGARGSRFDTGKTGVNGQGRVRPGGRTIKRAHGALRPTCACVTTLPARPGVCLDPFAGSGTTLLVARALGRHAVGVEASPVYTRLSRERLGLAALQAWEEGAAAPVTRVDDLPLFAQSPP
jgi:hypothetical protein